VGTLAGLVISTIATVFIGWELFGSTVGIAAGVGVALAGVPAVMAAVAALSMVRCGRHSSPRRLHVRIKGRTRELIAALARPSVGGAVVGLVSGSVAAVLADPAVAMTSFVVFGSTVGLTIGVTDFIQRSDPDSPAESPRRSFRRDCAYTLASAVVGGILLSCCAGISIGVAVGLSAGPVIGGVAGVISGVCSLFTVGLMFGFAVWVAGSASYMFLVSGLGAGLLSPRNLIFSLRMMRVLDDCHELGLLRAVGPIYQFRHARLQEYLSGLEVREPLSARRQELVNR
jgi:hypothetical protein